MALLLENVKEIYKIDSLNIKSLARYFAIKTVPKNFEKFARVS